jgi:hypothetical protein
VFETNQQLADDMRSWKNPLETPISSIYKSIPGTAVKIDEYRHLLSCIIDVAISRPITKCDQRPGTTSYKVTRMSEIKAGLLGNKYLEAKFYRPYFEIIDNKIKLISVISILSSKISTITIEYLSTHIS